MDTFPLFPSRTFKPLEFDRQNQTVGWFMSLPKGVKKRVMPWSGMEHRIVEVEVDFSSQHEQKIIFGGRHTIPPFRGGFLLIAWVYFQPMHRPITGGKG